MEYNMIMISKPYGLAYDQFCIVRRSIPVMKLVRARKNQSGSNIKNSMNHVHYKPTSFQHEPRHSLKIDLPNPEQIVGNGHDRRSANYMPNIWSYDFVQSLRSDFTARDESKKARIEKLKEEFIHSISEMTELSKLQVVDNILKLGLSNVFTNYISDTLKSIASNVNKTNDFKDNILQTSLRFRLLRQHGYNVSQDVFLDHIDQIIQIDEKGGSDLSGVVELYEASHLAIEGEEILVKVKDFAYKNLIHDHDHAKQGLAHASERPCHWRVMWFDVRHQIHVYEHEHDKDNNKILLELAKLNFNITQAMYIEELQETSRWWKNLGLIENINFSRDRLVESFLWSIGFAFEPQYAVIRKCLTKVITFVLVIDDLYDIYGSLEELEVFTNAVERWDCEELQQLPECMKICFETLRTTTIEIANDIEKEKGLEDISFYLNTAWVNFCKALLCEAQWYNNNHIPSLDDYLKISWITSSGPLLSLVSILCSAEYGSNLLSDKLVEMQDLIYYISLIIRLSNDLGTSAAELERGDSPSSILCYMVEANVSEEMAREHVKSMISNTWKKINERLLSASREQQMSVNLIVNIGRVCQFIYCDGDGFSVPNKGTRELIQDLLIQPIQLLSRPNYQIGNRNGRVASNS